ncbi:Niemann-Pick type C-related protein 1 [Wickerhamiella sorbophila]|uniref:Niemann-Pick type C-related protein 1 n=1 Tax=Wickerhamiella sorbophila TaxID=45607 RepID=A0A2T0FFU8_9ASCO|nr:Niemann-Pick type C-related protein 1 [Wickerhamiella sorbophila]PRT53829.1 Niemann-Pick type C-related protein 1 [Wickerhamiella sorbophila]
MGGMVVVYLSAIAATAAAQGCNMFGDCGTVTPFGAQLPCVLETEPQMLSDKASAQLQRICGEEYAGPVCCDEAQVATLESSLARAASIIGSCPACERNFFDVFCRFSCAPNQAKFVEILETQLSLDNRTVVKEVNYYVDRNAGSAIYDSCSGVKFGATNGRAMDLVGGGARDYKTFFKFLGDEKPMLGGSPFQINFEWDDSKMSKGYKRAEPYAEPCYEGDYKCSCVDCDGSCPALDPIDPPSHCTIWGLNCLSVGLLAGYLFVISTAVWVAFRVKKSRRKLSILEIQRLIEDDEDDQSIDDPLYFPLPRDLRPYKLNSLIESWFTNVAYFCARFPLSVFSVCVLAVLVGSLGLFYVILDVHPEKLWVGPNSLEAQEKQVFDSSFGSFYRTEQIFVVNETGPVLQSFDTLKWWASVEDRVANVTTTYLHDRLDDFCFKPINDACIVESVTQYVDIDRLTPANWRQRIAACAKSPVQCLPKFGQPISPDLVFGPYDKSVLDSRALVTTFVVTNRQDLFYKKRVEEWESLVESLLVAVKEEAGERGLRVSFSLESSLERELGKSSTTDVKVIILSYVLMFFYASMALGSKGRSGLRNTRFGLGFIGITIVLMSVASAIGISALLGYHLTLIITEVTPFLVLAVGIDNIFLLVHHFDLINELYPQYQVEDRLSRAVGLVGPSIFLSSTCEVLAFLLGAVVQMPAVHNFAIYSALAVFVNSLLQLTMFVSVMAIDDRMSRYGFWNGIRGDTSFSEPDLPGEVPDDTIAHEQAIEEQSDPRRFSQLLISEYAPFILQRGVRETILGVFLAWLAISLTLIPQLQLGLDQRLAVPQDSFLVDYFNDIYDYFQVGPPLYFVSDLSGEKREEQQKLCGRFSTCDEFSLANILEQERKRPEVSFISSPTASWIDDFFQWLNPQLGECCLEDASGKQCFEPGKKCHVCYENKKYEFDMSGFPTGSNFTHYVDLWLNAPSDRCPLAGKAPYSGAIDRASGHITASNFRTSFVPLRSQNDYIDAYNAARRVAEDISESTESAVFPYSVFFIFFAQYTSIVQDSVLVLSAAFGLIFVVAAVLLGSVRSSLIVTAVVAIMTANIAGMMVLFGVTLNALSLVNLVICVGIGVEFCIHIVRSFTFVHWVNRLGVRGHTRTDRAFNALTGTGGSVFAGIAITKLIGVTVLAFAKSKIFEVYYFRMWLALVICATTHALALLPILLSFWGGKMYLLGGEELSDQFGELEL